MPTLSELARLLLTQDPGAFSGVADIYPKPGNEVRIVEDLNAAYLTLNKLSERQVGRLMPMS
jgi:hypothetical protein